MVDANLQQFNIFQTHVHEFLGSTMLAAPIDFPELVHNHRFAGVTGPALLTNESHFHVISGNSDFFTSHFHNVDLVTGPPIQLFNAEGIPIGHIHVIASTTSINLDHAHNFIGTTLIQNPIEPLLMPLPTEE